MAQADLAAEVGVSSATMCRIERGALEPTDDLRVRLARALRCPEEAVSGGDFVIESVTGRLEVKPR